MARRSDVQCMHRWTKVGDDFPFLTSMPLLSYDLPANRYLMYLKVLKPGLVKGPWTGQRYTMCHVPLHSQLCEFPLTAHLCAAVCCMFLCAALLLCVAVCLRRQGLACWPLCVEQHHPCQHGRSHCECVLYALGTGHCAASLHVHSLS
jgi:hypothetical protein